MARPKPGNYAIYTEAGKKRYEAALRKYLANKKKAEEARKITSTKKNIEKQKTANKKAGTTTKTKTVAKTKTTPTSTAAKGKTLATGKTTSKTKAVETPKTKTVTKTKTRTRTQTKSQTTAKKPVAKKPVAKKPVAKKPAGEVPAKGKTSKNLKIKGDRYVRRGQFPKDKNYGNPVKKYQRTVVRPPEGKNYGKPLSEKGKSTNTGTKPTKVGNFKKAAKEGTQQVVKGTKKLASGVKGKVDEIKKVEQVQSGEPKTVQQKAVSKVYRGTKGLVKRGLSGAKDLLKIQNLKGLGKQGLAGLAAAGTAHVINKRVDRAFAASKGMTLKEFEKARKSEVGKRGLMRFRPKNIGNTINALKGKGKNNNQSSTTKNINKQKKDNNKKLKVNKSRGLKTQYSSNAAKKKQDFNAPTGTKKVDKRFASFRENPEANTKLQDERIKNKNTKETYSRKLSIKAKKNQSNNTTTSKTPRPGSARAKLREKNIKRFGEAHVNRLVAKNKEFQAIKRIKNREERKRRREAYRQKYGR